MSLRSVVPALLAGLSLMLALLLVSPQVHAAHWVVTYVSTKTVNGNAGQPGLPTTQPPHLSNYTDFSLQVTPTLTWTADNAADTALPPASVTYIEQGAVAMIVADYSYPPKGVHFLANEAANGLNSAVTSPNSPTSPSNYGSISVGYRSTTKPAGQTVVALASVTLSGKLLTDGANTSISTATSADYSVSSVAFSFIGTVKDSSGNDNILVGQGCTASVTGLPAGADWKTTYQWSIGGNKLQSFVISADKTTGTPTPFTSPNAASAHWYWSDTAGAKNVACTATVTPPSGQGDPFAVAATKTVNLQTPSVSVNVTPGAVQLNGTNAVTFGALFALYLGSSDTNIGQGITWKGNVKQPSVFNSQGPGTWHFTQLITPIRSRTKPKGTAEPSSNNGKSGLDTFDPYGNAAYFADNSSHTNGDSPGFGLDDTHSNYSVTETFQTYVMYQPPPAPSSDSILVPLYEIDWNWGANVNIVNSSWANFGNNSVGGKLTVTSNQLQTQHPTWKMLITKPPVW